MYVLLYKSIGKFMNFLLLRFLYIFYFLVLKNLKA